jgi:hypothetical protein
MATSTQQRTDIPVPQRVIDHSDKKVMTRMTVTLPEEMVVAYSEQADLAKVPLEKLISDRLRGCIAHTSGRGLYFNDNQRAHLERITGGHIIQDANDALAKVRTVVQVRIAGESISLELNERILTRAASRAKSCRTTTEKWLAKELLEGIERAVGLRP